MSPLACMPRSKKELLAVIAQLDPERNYLPEDLTGDGIRETKCNWLAADACFDLGVILPGQTPGPRVKAREQALWLAGPAGRIVGWRWAPADQALFAVNRGQPALCTWINPDPTRSSHIALGAPELESDDARRKLHAGENFIAQAGLKCFNNAPVSWGFGARKVDWWIID